MKKHWRTIWAITSKDLRDALRNRHAVVVIISALFVVIMYRFIPQINEEDERINVLVYDAGESSLVMMLENSPLLDVYTYDSQADMERYLANGDVPELGLFVPAGFDLRSRDASVPALTGYVMNWVSDAQAREMQQVVEGEIATVSGVAVPIHLSERRVYRWPDSGGNGVLIGMGMVFAILMVGMMLPTHLMIEERQAKTLDVLLVSPASAAHVVAGKTLTGVSYALLSASVGFVVNHAMIHRWGLAALAALSCALFSVMLGLLLGSTMRTRQQLSLWAWVLLVPLFFPMFLSLLDDLLPGWLITLFHWIPTVALFNVFRASFAGEVVLRDWAPRLALALGYTGLLLALLVWIVRRSDR
ncbi:MAG TPA: ABC transporter permease [Chloroflexi bacterium]|nr:ABC transporter permease [Chloroflexota bacterium]